MILQALSTGGPCFRQIARRFPIPVTAPAVADTLPVAGPVGVASDLVAGDESRPAAVIGRGELEHSSLHSLGIRQTPEPGPPHGGVPGALRIAGGPAMAASTPPTSAERTVTATEGMDYTFAGAGAGFAFRRPLGLGTVRELSGRIRRAAALLAVAALLGAFGGPALAQTEVPLDWNLKPTGVAAGGQFRLLFLSSTKRDGSSTDIATYNTFIQNLAAAGHDDIQAHSTGFRVVGCTSAVAARDNTSTTHTSADRGVPIYWLNGTMAADNYQDFYDGSWDDEANDKNESGTDGPDTSQTGNYPLTGCADDGTVNLSDLGKVPRPLGPSNVTLRISVGRPNSANSRRRPHRKEQLYRWNNVTRPMYGLSEVFQVAVPDNSPPEFSAETANRSVAENTAAGQDVGAVLTATDVDSDTLTYSLEGADAASFDIVSSSGQIRTRSGVTYDHEAKSTHTVIVKADDGNGGTDTIEVTITVTDVDEPPTAADSTVTTNEDTDYSFSSTDFSFMDMDQGDELASVKIVTLPASGKLSVKFTGESFLSELSFGAGLPKTVTVAELDTLKYRPPDNAHGTGFASFDFKVNDGTHDSATANTLTINVTAVNDGARGKPEIGGTARLGQTLMVMVDRIADVEGLPDPFLTDANTRFQWVRRSGGVDANIQGATASSYTLVNDDVGKAIKVRVWFRDREGNDEGPLTSDGRTVLPPNNRPTSGGRTWPLNEDGFFTLRSHHFPFEDDDPGDVLVSVSIVSLPAPGKGTIRVDGTEITSTDLPLILTLGRAISPLAR